MAEATKKAREAATQFANDSGAKVSGIKSANQGIISISDTSSTTGNSYDQGSSENPSTLAKKVRVVATVDYYLE